MSEPGGGAPGGRRWLLGDADRERLIALLREHYAAGRLDLDGLRHRVGVVLAAVYAEEAAVALADLPPAGVPGTPGAGRGGGSRGRHAQARKPEPGWVPTAERFRDPSSGVIMRVWIDPSDQSRHYVPDDAPAPYEQLEERPAPAGRGAQQLGVRTVFLPRCAKALPPPLNGREQGHGFADIAPGRSRCSTPNLAANSVECLSSAAE